MAAPGGSTPTIPQPVATSPEHALDLLMEGNRRWVEGNLAHPNRSVERRAELTSGQAPFATVFACIDSRVTPEIVFDCGLGDLVVVRSGAHALGETAVMGSLQFGVDQLRTPVLLVLGHEACGAVTAAIAAVDEDQELPAGLNAIVESIRPAYAAAKDATTEDVATDDAATATDDPADATTDAATADAATATDDPATAAPATDDAADATDDPDDEASVHPGDLVERTVKAHTRLTVQAITRAPLIARLVEGETLRVVGAYYSFDTGAVSILE